MPSCLQVRLPDLYTCDLLPLASPCLNMSLFYNKGMEGCGVGDGMNMVILAPETRKIERNPIHSPFHLLLAVLLVLEVGAAVPSQIQALLLSNKPYQWGPVVLIPSSLPTSSHRGSTNPFSPSSVGRRPELDIQRAHMANILAFLS